MIGFYLREDTVKYQINDKVSFVKSEHEADSQIKKGTFYQHIFANKINYWIISIARDSLIGPLTKAEFALVSKRLKIPGELKLD